MRTLLACLLLVWLAGAGVAQTRRPNVLFLLTDDQRADAVGAFGHPVLKTPNLDDLVRTGFVFRNTYCFGSNVPAVCQPSRTMLLSGRCYFRLLGPPALADRPNVPLVFKQAGYETYHHGKRGNVPVQIQELFEHNHYLQDQKERTSGQPGKTIVDHAITFLKRRDADRPFFMYLAFEAPHDPRVAAPEYLALYDRGKIPLPKNYLPVHPFDNGEMTIRDEQLAPWPRTEDEIRKHLHEYYAVISGLDFHIGRLLRALKDLGLDDQTIIVFSSDHGLALGSHGLMGKQNLYEAGMKVPLIFRGPGIPKGSSDALAYLFDVFPTLCHLGDVSVPEGLDGRSLAPIIQGGAMHVRDQVFLSYRGVQKAIREERWKLIRYPMLNRSQLFDLSTDPDENNDLAGDPNYEPIRARMMEKLTALQRVYGDVTSLSVDKPANGIFTPPARQP